MDKGIIKRIGKAILPVLFMTAISGCSDEITETQAVLVTATPVTSTTAETTEITSDTTTVTTTTVTTEAEEDYIGRIIADMTNEEKAGQVLLARYPQVDGAEKMDEYNHTKIYDSFTVFKRKWG